MDQKRTITLIISICVVLIAVIGVGVGLFYSRGQNTASGNQANSGNRFVAGLNATPGTGQSSTVGQGTGTAGTSTTTSEVQNQASTASGANSLQTGSLPPNNGSTGTPPVSQTQNQELVIVYGSNGTPSYRVGPDGKLIQIEDPTKPAGAGTQGQSSNQNATQGQSSTTQAGTGTSGSGTAAASSASNRPTGTTALPSGSSRGSQAQAATSSSSSGSRTATTTASASRPSTSSGARGANAQGIEYWIQIISSPNRDRIEQVRLDMVSMGFNGRISSRAVDGKDYWRLRFGPYSNRDEAAKFLEWVKLLKGFEQSLIFEEKLGG